MSSTEPTVIYASPAFWLTWPHDVFTQGFLFLFRAATITLEREDNPGVIGVGVLEYNLPVVHCFRLLLKPFTLG